MNASPAMELGSPLLVHGARVRFASAEGERVIAVHELWLGPGTTSARSTELLTEVIVPRVAPGSASAYVRLEYRQAMEIAVVGAAAFVSVDEGRISEVSLALTAVAPTCVLVEGVADVLRDETIGSAPLDRAAQLAVEQARPLSDVRASAEYRRAQVAVMARRAIGKALARTQSENIDTTAGRPGAAA